MAGSNGGIQKLISDELKRQIPYIHCFNHQLHLAVLEMISSNSKFTRAFDVAEQLYVFFKRLAVCSRYNGDYSLLFILYFV